MPRQACRRPWLSRGFRWCTRASSCRWTVKGNSLAKGSADEQIEQVLDNLEAVLDAAGSGLDKLVRLNVYALSHQTADRLRELLSKRLDPAVRPAITAVLTPLPHRKALVAVDAVAVAAGERRRPWPSSDARPWPATRTAPMPR